MHQGAGGVCLPVRWFSWDCHAVPLSTCDPRRDEGPGCTTSKSPRPEEVTVKRWRFRINTRGYFLGPLVVRDRAVTFTSCSCRNLSPEEPREAACKSMWRRGSVVPEGGSWKGQLWTAAVRSLCTGCGQLTQPMHRTSSSVPWDGDVPSRAAPGLCVWPGSVLDPATLCVVTLLCGPSLWGCVGWRRLSHVVV